MKTNPSPEQTHDIAPQLKDSIKKIIDAFTKHFAYMIDAIIDDKDLTSLLRLFIMAATQIFPKISDAIEIFNKEMPEQFYKVMSQGEDEVQKQGHNQEAKKRLRKEKAIELFRALLGKYFEVVAKDNETRFLEIDSIKEQMRLLLEAKMELPPLDFC